MLVVYQGHVFDAYTVAVETWEHVHAIALHQFVPIDCILADHIHEVTEMSGAIGERRS